VASFGRWDIGGCNCDVTEITVVGCGTPGNYPGITLSIYTASGGTLLYSGTSDSNGQIHPTSLPAGTWYVTSSGQSAAFYPIDGNVVFLPGPNVIQLTPSEGGSLAYFCIAGPCVQPLPQTLSYSGAFKDTLVITSSGVLWQGEGSNVYFDGGSWPPVLFTGAATNPTLTSYSCPPGAVYTYSDGSTVTSA